MGAVTMQDKAFIAAVAGRDERRPNDRAAILSAYRATYGVGDGLADKGIMAAYHRLMKQDGAKDAAERVVATQEAAIGVAAAAGAGELVSLAMQEQKDMRQARANAARLVKELTARLADDPGDKRVTLAGLAKLLTPIFEYDLGEDEGLDAATAKAMQGALGAGAAPATDEPLPLPTPERRVPGMAWPSGGGNA